MMKAIFALGPALIAAPLLASPVMPSFRVFRITKR